MHADQFFLKYANERKDTAKVTIYILANNDSIYFKLTLYAKNKLNGLFIMNRESES